MISRRTNSDIVKKCSHRLARALEPRPDVPRKRAGLAHPAAREAVDLAGQRLFPQTADQLRRVVSHTRLRTGSRECVEQHSHKTVAFLFSDPSFVYTRSRGAHATPLRGFAGFESNRASAVKNWASILSL